MQRNKTGNMHICKFFFQICKVFEKIKSFFSEIFFATGLVFERFLAPRSRFFEKVNGLGVFDRAKHDPSGSFENSYIPENSPNFLCLPNRYSFQKTDFGTLKNVHNQYNSLKKIRNNDIYILLIFAHVQFFLFFFAYVQLFFYVF
ncbi:hypothetical protein LXL04_037998 [Taraxacum kok-saghyz]